MEYCTFSKDVAVGDIKHNITAKCVSCVLFMDSNRKYNERKLYKRCDTFITKTKIINDTVTNVCTLLYLVESIYPLWLSSKVVMQCRVSRCRTRCVVVDLLNGQMIISFGKNSLRFESQLEFCVHRPKLLLQFLNNT